MKVAIGLVAVLLAFWAGLVFGYSEGFDAGLTDNGSLGDMKIKEWLCRPVSDGSIYE